MVTPENILDFIRDVISDMKDIVEEDFTFELTLEELSLDSLDYVEVQLAVKKKYGVVIDQELFINGKIKTLKDFCDFVAESAGNLVKT